MSKKITNSKEELRKHRARLRLNMLAGFRETPNVSIGIIPNERTLFPNTVNDYWQKLNSDEEHTSCIYDLDSNGIFATHKHQKHDETCELLTEGSKVEWVTEEGIYFYSYGQKFKAPKGMEHALVSLVDFPIKLKVDWKPKMNNEFDIEFKE